MKEETRLRAMKALTTCRPTKESCGNYFAEVYVVGDEIYFAYNAAMRKRVELVDTTHKPHEIETIEIWDALKVFPPENPSEEVKPVKLGGELYNGNLFNKNII